MKEYLKHFEALGANEVYIKDATQAAPIQRAPERSNIVDKILEAAKTVQDLEAAVLAFSGCKLKLTATKTVFADGNPDSKLMLIGEAPGASEDAEGIPFCGRSGQLLNNIFASIGYPREELYISNTIFWRPPGNRRPTKEELAICKPFVEKHIALVKPKLLILVGSTAVEALLGDETSMHSVRDNHYLYTNQYLDGEKIATFAIFHPSYLLRQPQKKKLMWYDILKIREYLEGNV